MIRYRLRPIVTESDGDMIWAAALPCGPIMGVGGGGALLLDLLASCSSDGADVSELFSKAQDAVSGVPADGEELVREFLTNLVEGGVVEVVRRAEE